MDGCVVIVVVLLTAQWRYAASSGDDDAMRECARTASARYMYALLATQMSTSSCHVPLTAIKVLATMTSATTDESRRETKQQRQQKITKAPTGMASRSSSFDRPPSSAPATVCWPPRASRYSNRRPRTRSYARHRLHLPCIALKEPIKSQYQAMDHLISRQDEARNGPAAPAPSPAF